VKRGTYYADDNFVIEEATAIDVLGEPVWSRVANYNAYDNNLRGKDLALLELVKTLKEE